MAPLIEAPFTLTQNKLTHIWDYYPFILQPMKQLIFLIVISLWLGHLHQFFDK